MRKSCVQAGYERCYRSGTKSVITHKPGYQNYTPVHKYTVSTQTGAQLSGLYHPTYTQLFSLFNRLCSRVIPIFHRAYIKQLLITFNILLIGKAFA
jgi:hypothetical protein